MDKPTIEELKSALEANEPTSTQPVEPEAPTEPTEPTEDPLKVELERVQSKKSPQQKAKDALFFNAKKALELGVGADDVAEALGIKPKEVVEDDDKPVTRKELEELLLKQRQDSAVKSAEQLVNEIQDETERELTMYHLSNSIKSTGDAKEDLRLARALTNSVRTAKILEEIERKPVAKTHSSATTAGTVTGEPAIVFTPEEKAFLATGKITKDEILLARKGQL